jgi:polyhydroxyalkanoate synthesis regulator phasin
MADANSGKPVDPLAAWRDMRDASMEAWANVMNDVVRTDAYAQSSGVLLDTYLTTSGPFYEFFQKAMSQTLQELNLPSRTDFASLSERLTNIEIRLDDMDAKLDRIAAKIAEPASPPASREKTTRPQQPKTSNKEAK